MAPDTRPDRVDRRDFHKLTAAALSGLAAGAVLGCRGEPAATGPAITPVKSDIHLCRGLNECKGQGQGGDNACRGQGACATATEHACGGQNECKGLGGCGASAGENECKTKGGCHVPLMEGAWTKLRAKKEAEWTEKNLEAGDPPPESKDP